MINISKKSNFSEWILLLFIVIALCYPYTSLQYESIAAPNFILANVFAVLYVGSVLCRPPLQVKTAPYLSTAILALLLCFNLCAAYVNYFYVHWYDGQIHVTVSFLFFLSLILSENSVPKERILKWFLAIAILSNLVGILPYFFNNYGVSIKGFYPQMIPMAGQYDERRYSWLYPHKSEYALTLVLFLSLIITYRSMFPRKWMFWGSIGVMILGLVISNTRTTMVASLFVFIGWLLDEMKEMPRKTKVSYALLLIPIVCVLGVLLYVVSQKRDLLTLGSRTYIWKASIEEILKNPHGLGANCGTEYFTIPVWPEKVYNCHNVFLNILLQFSIPAGAFYIFMLLSIFCASVKHKPCFLTLGIWIALLIPMNMDWCLLLSQFSLFLLSLYFLFFYQAKSPRS